jgi:hypothetical protein
MADDRDEDDKFSGLDHLAPGAGAAARMGEELAKRTIRYACQNAGVGVKGLLEALPEGDNPKVSIGNPWFGWIIKAIRP